MIALTPTPSRRIEWKSRFFACSLYYKNRNRNHENNCFVSIGRWQGQFSIFSLSLHFINYIQHICWIWNRSTAGHLCPFADLYSCQWQTGWLWRVNCFGNLKICDGDRRLKKKMMIKPENEWENLKANNTCHCNHVVCSDQPVSFGYYNAHLLGFNRKRMHTMWLCKKVAAIYAQVTTLQPPADEGSSSGSVHLAFHFLMGNWRCCWSLELDEMNEWMSKTALNLIQFVTHQNRKLSTLLLLAADGWMSVYIAITIPEFHYNSSFELANQNFLWYFFL